MAHRRGSGWRASGYDRATKTKRHIGTFSTKREAVAAEADWKLRAQPVGRVTCDQFAARWMVDYPRPRASTMRTHSERVRRFARDFAGVRLADVDRPTARAWARHHPNDAPIVRTMYADALRDGLVLINPFAGLRLPQSRGRKDIVAITDLELQALAAIATDPRMELGAFAPQYRALILWAGYTGTRPGETFALRRDDIRGEHVTVSRSYSSHSRETTAPKNGQPRVITIPPPALEALADVPRHASGLLFVTPTGGQWTQSAHHRYWSRLRLLADRPGFDFYELRHAAATMLLERGATPWDVAVQLGHTDGGELVMRLYGHPSEAGARARLRSLWDDQVQPLHAVSGPTRAQRSR